MRTRTRVGLAGAVAAATMLVAPAAVAAHGDGVCEVAESCLFKNKNYAGGMADVNVHDADWRNNHYNTGGSAHNTVSSGGPHGRAVQYFNTPNFGGKWFILGISQFDTDWTSVGWTPYPNFNFNNRMSSSYIYVPPL